MNLNQAIKRVVDTQSPVLTYEPWGGDDIKETINACCALSQIMLKQVSFDFNGEVVTVNKESDPVTVLATWYAERDRKAEEYRNSTAYAEAQAQRAKEVSQAQVRIDSHLKGLPAAVDSTRKLCQWLNFFTGLCDEVGVNCDLVNVMSIIEGAGYVSNANTYDKDMTDDERAVVKHALATKEGFGRYLVGQALSCMKMGMGPHPVFQTFYKRDYVPMKPVLDSERV